MFVNSKDNLNIYIPSVLKRFKEIMGYDCNLEHPRYFTEKIQWLKIYDVTKEKKYCSDKLNLRNYCKEKLDIDLCPKVLKVYNKHELINIKDVPEKCVFKCNHGSTWNIIKDSDNFNLEETYTKLNEWCNINYAYYNDNYEFQYKDIIPKYFIEEYLNIDSEYKFYCFNGKVEFCQIIWYDDLFEKGIWPIRDWSRHDATVSPRFTIMEEYQFFTQNRPRETRYLKNNYELYYNKNYNIMLDYCKKLSSDFKFVRVDFYNTKENNIYLSELTFTPSNGFLEFKRKEADQKLGELLKI